MTVSGEPDDRHENTDSARPNVDSSAHADKLSVRFEWPDLAVRLLAGSSSERLGHWVRRAAVEGARFNDPEWPDPQGDRNVQ